MYAKKSSAKGHPKTAVAEPPMKSIKKDILLSQKFLPREIKNIIIHATQLNALPIKYITKKFVADILLYIQ